MKDKRAIIGAFISMFWSTLIIVILLVIYAIIGAILGHFDSSAGDVKIAKLSELKLDDMEEYFGPTIISARYLVEKGNSVDYAFERLGINLAGEGGR